MKQFKTSALRSNFTQSILLLLLVFSFAQVSFAQKKIDITENAYILTVFNTKSVEQNKRKEAMDRSSGFVKELGQVSFLSSGAWYSFNTFIGLFSDGKNEVEFYREYLNGEKVRSSVKDIIDKHTIKLTSFYIVQKDSLEGIILSGSFPQTERVEIELYHERGDVAASYLLETDRLNLEFDSSTLPDEEYIVRITVIRESQFDNLMSKGKKVSKKGKSI